MATINTAEAFYAQRDLGVIAPGRYADVLLVSNLRDFAIETVIFGGTKVVQAGSFLVELPKTEYPDFLRNTVKLPKPIRADDLTFGLDTSTEEVEVRVI